MVNEFKLAVVHIARPNPMQTCACAWIYRWTKNCGKSGLGLRATGPSQAAGRWAVGRRAAVFIRGTIYGQVFSVRVICKVLQPYRLINKTLWYIAIVSLLIENL